MAAEPRRLDYWRKYLRSANGGIFDVIEHAILVAASDCPTEFLVQRDRIAETLFSCQLARCHGCDKVKQQFSPEEDLEEPEREGDGLAVGVEKERKFSSMDDGEEVGANRVVSNYSYDEAEALTEEIEEENQMIGEVLRIKEILANHEDEPDSLLFESLRRLQLMGISVETLKATEIGKAVNGLRKHHFKDIRQLVRTLIDGWKALVDEWVNATAALTENTPESLNPSVVDYEEGFEEGLPSPPMDEGALFGTTTMELSEFFDGMDDDGNPRNNYRSQGNGRKPPTESRNNSMRMQQSPYQSTTSEDKGQMRKQEALNRQAKPGFISNQTKTQEHLIKQSKPQEDLGKQTRHQEAPHRQNKQPNFAAASGPGRPTKTGVENRVTSDSALQQRQEHMGTQKKPSTGLQDKSKNSEDTSVRAKLEAAKRKLQAGYQQAENAKKQRTIQVMELSELPKQGLGNRQPFFKQGNHNKFRANGRR